MSDGGIDKSWNSTTNVHLKKGCSKADKVRMGMSEVMRLEPCNPHKTNLKPDELAKLMQSVKGKK